MATADLLETITISAGGGGSTSNTSDITTGALGGTVAAAALSTITITAADDADVTMGAIDAEGASITSITASANTSGSVITFGTIGVSTTQITSIGEVNLTAVSGASVLLSGNVYATTIGTITASGAGTITMDGGASSITTIEQFNAGSASGTVTVDFTGATVAISATMGTGTNTFVAGNGGDTVTLASGDGTDIVEYTALASDSSIVTVHNFTSATDKIRFDASDILVSDAIDSSGDVSMVVIDGAGAAMGTGASMVVEEVTGAETLVSGDDIFVLVGSSLANTAAVETAIEASGDFALTMGSTISTDEAFFLVYSDGTDSYIAAATVIATANAAALASAETSVVNLVKLAGVSSISTGDFVSADFYMNA
jgi:hypothetical protein